MSKKYGKNPHIIYEIFNEPLQVSWASIKDYHQAVVNAIRANDKKNIIILGTPGKILFWVRNTILVYLLLV
jgi:endoglucanase